jgi:hypothetical protein
VVSRRDRGVLRKRHELANRSGRPEHTGSRSSHRRPRDDHARDHAETTDRTTIDGTTRRWIGVKARDRLAMLCGVMAAALVVASCGTTSPAPPPEPSPPPPRSLPSPHDAALAAYRTFWEVSDAARAAPTERDWRPELESVSRGQALETALIDVANYASIPARTVGTISRSPVIDHGTPDSVTVLDCVDLGDSRLIDASGGTLDDLENQLQRFRLRAEVVRDGDRWLVEQTTPAVSEPC